MSLKILHFNPFEGALCCSAARVGMDLSPYIYVRPENVTLKKVSEQMTNLEAVRKLQTAPWAIRSSEVVLVAIENTGKYPDCEDNAKKIIDSIAGHIDDDAVFLEYFDIETLEFIQETLGNIYTKDYSITVTDSEGHTLELSINGNTVDELGGDWYARERVEENEVLGAQDRGELAQGIIIKESDTFGE